MMFNLYVFALLSIVFEFSNITNYPKEFNTSAIKNHVEIPKYQEYI